MPSRSPRCSASLARCMASPARIRPKPSIFPCSLLGQALDQTQGLIAFTRFDRVRQSAHAALAGYREIVQQAPISRLCGGILTFAGLQVGKGKLPFEVFQASTDCLVQLTARLLYIALWPGYRTHVLTVTNSARH